MTSLRLSMWSGPRNVSTALMYSFRQRSDTKVVDEPLYGHYLRATGAQHPAAPELMSQLECDASRVIESMLQVDYGRSIVFFKNMAHHLRGLEGSHVNDLFSGALTHALLIRDPHEMLPSLAKVLSAPTLADTGLAEQCEILERELRAGRHPVIIDSRDLLLDPRRILSQICDSSGVPFEEEMLDWPSGPKPEDGSWAPYWYANVHASTGFSAYRPPDEAFPAELAELLGECLPYYQRLRECSRPASRQGTANTGEGSEQHR